MQGGAADGDGSLSFLSIAAMGFEPRFGEDACVFRLLRHHGWEAIFQHSGVALSPAFALSGDQGQRVSLDDFAGKKIQSVRPATPAYLIPPGRVVGYDVKIHSVSRAKDGGVAKRFGWSHGTAQRFLDLLLANSMISRVVRETVHPAVRANTTAPRRPRPTETEATMQSIARILTANPAELQSGERAAEISCTGPDNEHEFDCPYYRDMGRRQHAAMRVRREKDARTKSSTDPGTIPGPFV